VPCGLSFDTLTARHFSFNSPYGACPTCHGLGTMQVFDEDLVVPDADQVAGDGAIRSLEGRRPALMIYYKGCCAAVCKHFGVEMDTPYGELPKKVREVLLHGSGEEEIVLRLLAGRGLAQVRQAVRGRDPQPQAPLRGDGQRITCGRS
jgi:excinuclease ABC subunit A